MRVKGMYRLIAGLLCMMMVLSENSIYTLASTAPLQVQKTEVATEQDTATEIIEDSLPESEEESSSETTEEVSNESAEDYTPEEETSTTASETEETTTEIVEISEIESVFQEELEDLYVNDMSGSGTDEDPYIITTVSQLKAINNDLTASYKLGNDLYLGTDSWEPIGNSEIPFSGHFNGDDHIIYGLNGFSIDFENRGLFGVISSQSVIECLGIEMDEGVRHTADPNDLAVSIGMLVGSSSGTIRNCYAKGILSASHVTGGSVPNYSGVNNCGILCGWVTGTIDNCYTEGYAYAPGYSRPATGSAGAGGICGKGTGIITNSYSVCTAYAPGSGYAAAYDTASGIIGGSDSVAKINSCYAICDAGYSNRSTGIADSDNIQNCYYILTRKDGISTNASSVEAMKLASTYKGWDFKNTWVMGLDGYPKLQYFQKNKSTEFELIASLPGNGEELVPVNTDITMYFNKNISGINTENVRIYSETNEEVPFNLDCSGKKIVLDLEENLDEGKKYCVEIDANAINAYDGQNVSDTNSSKIEFSFTSYDKSQEFTAGKYVTFTEKNGVKIPSDNIAEYVEELKYWAEEYGIRNVAVCNNLEDILQKKVSFPAKIKDSDNLCLIKTEDVTLLDLMRDELFVEEYQPHLENTFQQINSATNYGEVVNAYRISEQYTEQLERYFKEERNTKFSVIISFAVSLLFETGLGFIEVKEAEDENVINGEEENLGYNESGYKMIKPLLRASHFEFFYHDELCSMLEGYDYEGYKEGKKAAEAAVKGGSAIYKAKVLGDKSTLIEFGSDVFSFAISKTNNEWLKDFVNTIEGLTKNGKRLTKCIERALYIGNTMNLVFLIPDLVEVLWSSFNEKTRAWYYLSDYYICENYPYLYEFCFEDDLYPVDAVFEMGINDFPAYITLYGTPEQISEIQECDNDPILGWWCQFISKNIRAEKHLRGENLSYRNNIKYMAINNASIGKIDVNKLKLTIVKYASSLINEEEVTTVMVECPVVVKVYDKSTCELVATVSSEDKDYQEDIPYISIYNLGEDKETKCIVLSSNNYYLEIVPYEAGTMDVSVGFGEDTSFIHKEIQIKEGETYFIENTNEDYFELINQDESIIEPVEKNLGCEIEIGSSRTLCNVGETIKYDAVIYPKYAEDSVVWSVDNTEIGTIDADGTFHALQAGKTTISACLNSNNSIADTKEITVISLDENNVELNTDVELKENESKKLEITGLTDLEIQALSWYSDSPDVAQITRDGYVIGVDAGETTIIAEYRGIEITVNVTVQKQTYTVCFDFGYDNITTEVTDIEYNQIIELPEVSYRFGYSFVGWYTERNGKGELFTSDSLIKSNTTIYAYWIELDFGEILEEDVPENAIIPDGIWIAGIDDQTYSGSSIKQSFRVYDGMKRLKQNTDYTITYKNNKNAYTYTDGDYAAFEENLKLTGKRMKVGTFDPKKAPQITVKMKGNYSGSRVIYFKIEQADIVGDAFETGSLTVTYTGKKQTPAPKLTWNGKALKYGTDFYIPEYDAAKKDKTAFKETGTYHLTITGKKNFTGEIPIALTISESAKQIAMNKVKVTGIKNKPWTGDQIVQTGFSVKYGKDVLSEEKGDYTIEWGENTDAGTGTVTFIGTGTDEDGDGFSYIGSKKVSFKINGTAMSKVAVSDVKKSYAYTGKEIRPEASLTYKPNKNGQEIPLTEGTHYTAVYQKNVDKGTATILFTGLASGGYTGTKKVTFKIISAEVGDTIEGENTIENIHISFVDTKNIQNGVYVAPHMKGGAKPEVIVTSGDKTLEAGKDYKVNYSNNKKPALSTATKAPTVTVTGKGNYKGSKSKAFTIEAKALSNENGITVVAKDKVENLKKNGYRQSFKVYDADGKVLGNKDYDTLTVTYTLIQKTNKDGTVSEVYEQLDKKSIVPAGSIIRITVQGKGIYAGGEASGIYRILKKNYDISKATIQINNQVYTGKPVTITDINQFKTGKLYIKNGKEIRELIFGEDIEIVPDSYVNNINKGTAKVTFRGINDFGGTKTVSFKIGTRSITDFWKGIYAKMAEMWN